MKTFLWAVYLGWLITSGAQAALMDTVRITITGGDLAAPIVITDPAVTKTFKVWAGPGNFRLENGSDVRIPVLFAQGFIIDWSRGVVEPPKGLNVYEVSFLTTRTSRNTYVVSYMIDPLSNRGFVYIPGKGEKAYADNTWMIFHGIEGNWFYAWSKWEELAHRLIANTAKAH